MVRFADGGHHVPALIMMCLQISEPLISPVSPVLASESTNDISALVPMVSQTHGVTSVHRKVMVLVTSHRDKFKSLVVQVQVVLRF
jgi:hypothetical protein